MRKVKLAMIVNDFNINGISNVVMSYCKALDKEKFEVHIIAGKPINLTYKKEAKQNNIVIWELPSRKQHSMAYYWKLWRVLKKEKFAIAHVHGNSATITIELFLAWINNIKVRIAHSHNTKCEHVKIDKMLRPVFNLLYTNALACGDTAGKWLFGDKNFKVLANGRNIDKYKFDFKLRNKIRESLGIKDVLVIGHVGGFYEQKNHKFLIDIYKEIKKIEPDCILFMIGDGPLYEEIKKRSCNLGVIFTGAIDNVPDYLNAMDGMVLPSLFEGLPLVAIEWQINGLPCVLSDSISKECRVTDTVKFLNLKDTPRKWAELIINEAKNNNRQKAADNAYKKFNGSIYNINKTAQILEELYKY